jgi:aminotransferase
MAGWRVGFAVGNKDIIEKLELIQDHLYVSIFGAVQMAAIAALTGDQSATKALTATYEKRRNVLIDALSDIGWNVTKPSGTFFCWLKIPEGYTSESFSRYLLDTAKVMVAPGNGFGDYGEGYVRVALLDSDTRLSEAAKRIEATNIFNTTTTANL